MSNGNNRLEARSPKLAKRLNSICKKSGLSHSFALRAAVWDFLKTNKTPGKFFDACMAAKKEGVE